MFVVPAAGLFVPPFVALITITKALSGYTFGVRSSASCVFSLGIVSLLFPVDICTQPSQRTLSLACVSDGSKTSTRI